MTKAQLVADARVMIMNGAEPPELVTYVPHQGVPRDIYMHMTRQVESVEFSSGAGVPILEHQGFVISDPVEGMDCIQDGKDQIHMKANLSDASDSVFRVVSHVSRVGAHTVRLRL